MKYKLADPTVQILSGTITAIVSASIVQNSWNMFLGMILGNFIGMFFMIILMIPLTIVFGGFEIMIPLFLVTMSCGMVGGMLGTVERISLNQVAFTGALVSLMIFAYVAWSDHKLRGQVPNEK
jgi:fucose 4-O-acetylase-like acetyltransferase